MEAKRAVVRKYDWSEIQYNEIKISNRFYDCYFNSENYEEIPLHAVKIIFYLIASVSRDQFYPEDREKIQNYKRNFLFDDNCYAIVKVKNSLVSDSITHIRKALEFLNDYKKKWYHLNGDDRNLKSYGGLISFPNYTESFGYSSFLVSSYWMEKILNIEPYNSIDLEKLRTCKVRSSKYILFALWINKLPLNTETFHHLQTLNKRFGLRYKTARDFAHKFLKNCLQTIIKFNQYKFLYHYKAEKITIKKLPNDFEINLIGQPQVVTKRISYLKKHYGLEDAIDFMTNYKNDGKYRRAFEEAFKSFKKKCKQNKIKISQYKGRVFLIELQKEIVENYLVTKAAILCPKGYIKII